MYQCLSGSKSNLCLPRDCVKVPSGCIFPFFTPKRVNFAEVTCTHLTSRGITVSREVCTS